MAITVRKKSASQSKKSGWWRRVKIALSVLLMFFMIGFMGISVVAFQKLEKAKLMVYKLTYIIDELNNQPSKIVSADGVTLYQVQAEYRKSVRIDDIPKKVIDAILAAEDKRFYTHGGVDFWSLVRIGVVAFQSGGNTKESGGGSTLSMQIAKRVFTGDKHTLDRKLDNMALAVEMEKRLTKDQILELYLNQVYFGERAYGISAAADVYFGKKLDDLTISEAATLARCVRRPSDQNPVRNPEVAKENRDAVLFVMYEEKMIKKEQYKEALAEEIKVAKQRPQIVTGRKLHPYFVDYTINELAKQGVDISGGGYTVHTTLNTKYQKIAEKGVDKWVDRLSGYRVNQMAILVTDNNGRIISMVGGPDYEKSEFNMMWMGPGRQLGSSMKPFVYLTGLDRGIYGEGSTVSTAPIKKRGTREYIKGGANRGNVSITSALASSNNTAASRAIEEVGEANVLNMCRRNLGFRRSNLQAVQSLALGSGEVYMTEVAEAYSVIQSHGDRYPTYAIERIDFPDGSQQSYAPPKARSVVSSSAAEFIDLSLRQVVTNGTGHYAQGVRNSRGKTGTTSDHKDAWFCGYTDKLIGLVWVADEQIVDGRPKAMPMRGLFGGEGPARVWNDVMGDIQNAMGEKSRSFGRLPNVTKSGPDDPQEEDPVVPDEPLVIPDEPTEDVTPVETPPDTPANTTGTTGTGATGTGGGAGNQAGQEVVYVSVCADSGQRANAYCPETVRRPFFKGSEPKGSCPLHGPTTAYHKDENNNLIAGLIGNVSHTYTHGKSNYGSLFGRSVGLVFLLQHHGFSTLDASNR
ncbi:MAG: transglycosylase domain-containing protein [Fimbriimonadaceae bacterium]